MSPDWTPGSKRFDHAAYRLMLRDRIPGDVWTLRFDGGCKSNGSQAAKGRWAFVLEAGSERISGNGEAHGNPVTVNTCEWQALVSGLRRMIEEENRVAAIPKPRLLLIEGDSDLIIRQLTAVWGCRDQLVAWRDEAIDILAEFGVQWYAQWIPRTMNSECDALCTMKGTA